MDKFKIHLIAAARPNFMKIAPLYHCLSKKSWADARIVHTGQHYDLKMSDAFFTDLNLPEPHVHLGIGSGSHAEQTGAVMIAYEKTLIREKPDLVIVVGDVNSTLAATLAASKLGIATAHLEAGLRSFDRTMPEEINRLVTDALADILWTPSPDADENLLKAGISADKIVRVGNIMIDSLEMMRGRIEAQQTFNAYGLDPREYGVVTLHRPANVDSPEILRSLGRALIDAGGKIPLIFPVHPRTLKNLKANGLLAEMASARDLILTEPISYLPFMNLVFNSRLVITDSGGLQEETTYLGIACLTLRPNTERPVTIEMGTNRLCRVEAIGTAVEEILSGRARKGRVPQMWDGRTAERVVQSIEGRIKKS